MQLVRARILGFKSFAEPTDVPVLAGLTGIVGPNGCGKSNLVDALRFAMGEGSAGALRGQPGGALDALIFGGTSRRPARNIAEVLLMFHETDGAERQIVRRLVRGEGSRWLINGRDARGRDVRVMLADHGMGPGGAAIVGQGRVAQLIAQRPEERRILVDEVAGVAGLALRRREVARRVEQVRANLARARERTAELEAGVARLERQARQARRYREVADALRRHEALAAHLAAALAGEAHERASDEARRAATVRDEARRRLASQDVAVAESGRRAEGGRAEAAHAGRLAAEAEAEALRLRLAEAARLERLADAAQAQERSRADAGRVAARLADAHRARAGLDEEAGRLEAEDEALGGAVGHDAAADEAAAERAAAATARALARSLAAHAEATAVDRAARASATAAAERQQRLAREMQTLAAEQARLSAEKARAAVASDLAGLEAAAAAAPLVAAQEALARALEQEALRARGWETSAAHAARAQADLSAVESEARALAQQSAGGQGRSAPLVEAPAGLEAAVAAALGDGLTAPLAGPGAPVDRPGWHEPHRPDPAPPPLPPGATPLAAAVAAPPALARRMAMTGLVDGAPDAAVWRALAPGQRLVSRSGGLWTWDGRHRPPGEAAALGLALATVRRARELRSALPQAQETARLARAARDAAEEQRKACSAATAVARRTLSAAEEQQRRAADRAAMRARALADLEARLARLAEESRSLEAARAREAAEAEGPGPGAEGAPRELLARVGEARDADERARRQLAEVRAAARGRMLRQSEIAARRRALAHERAAWDGRAAAARAEGAELEAHGHALAARVAELEAAAAGPHAHDLSQTETGRLQDAAARAQARLAEALARLDQRAAEQAALRLRLERAVEAAARTEAEAQARARDADAARAAVPAEVPPADDDPGRGTLAQRLQGATAEATRWRQARERLGPVNLAAEAELADAEQVLATEREALADVEEAARRIDASLAALEREARQRIDEGFRLLDERFGALFARLFGGGRAQLAWAGGADRLTDGLLLMAQPPGKRLQSLGLLSGGEQALTALSLILARIALAPAAVVVLDEVDAPLDDANAERLMELVRSLAGELGRRFLVVTHNPVSMERMDRLIGVTMGEPGVSRLVGLDLAGARRLAGEGAPAALA